MIVASTLSLYVARVFSFFMMGILAVLTLLFSLFDFIELLRRAAPRADVSFSLVAELAGLRLPWIAIQTLPFAVLLGGMFAFEKLTRSSELVVARAAGMSAWQFLAGPTLCAIALGGFATTIANPLAAAMFARADQIDAQYLKTGGGPLALNGGQLWLRQADRGLDPKGIAIIHAYDVKLRAGQLTAGLLSVMRLDGADRLLERIEAVGGALDTGMWRLAGATVSRPGKLPDAAGNVRLPTDVTVGRVEDSFASPDALSFWSLPGFIRELDRAGFSSIRQQLRFQSLLALPLVAGTMALLAAGFSMRPARRGGVGQMIASGVGAGFLLFLITKIAEEFGQSGELPALLAAWAPAGAGMMLSVALLLHLEDG